MPYTPDSDVCTTPLKPAHRFLPLCVDGFHPVSFIKPGGMEPCHSMTVQRPHLGPWACPGSLQMGMNTLSTCLKSSYALYQSTPRRFHFYSPGAEAYMANKNATYASICISSCQWNYARCLERLPPADSVSVAVYVHSNPLTVAGRVGA